MNFTSIYVQISVAEGKETCQEHQLSFAQEIAKFILYEFTVFLRIKMLEDLKVFKRFQECLDKIISISVDETKQEEKIFLFDLLNVLQKIITFTSPAVKILKTVRFLFYSLDDSIFTAWG